MSEKNKKPFMPGDYRNKDVIFIHLPIFNIPITKRQVYFAAFGIPITILIILITAKYFNPKDIKGWIPIAMFSIAIPIYFATLLTKERDGRYLEDRIKTKLIHKKNAGISYNEKALKAMKEGDKY